MKPAPTCCFCGVVVLSFDEVMGWVPGAEHLSGVDDGSAGRGFIRHPETGARLCRPCFETVREFADKDQEEQQKEVSRKARREISTAVRIRVLRRGEFRCAICPATERLTIDHIVPVAHGGSNDETNLQVLCSPCNSRKGARTA